jgi:hypothetical protein
LPYGQQRLWRASLGSLPLVAHFRELRETSNSRSLHLADRAACGGSGRGVMRQEEDLRLRDGYYEVHKQVCIDSRRSRLLWGSGNARRNRMDVERGAGAGFPNPDGTNVGVLENRPTGRWEQSKSPTASTGRDAQCAMPLSWMGGNMGRDRAGSGDGSVWFSTAGRLGPGFAVNPQIAAGCGGAVRIGCPNETRPSGYFLPAILVARLVEHAPSDPVRGPLCHFGKFVPSAEH